MQLRSRRYASSADAFHKLFRKGKMAVKQESAFASPSECRSIIRALNHQKAWRRSRVFDGRRNVVDADQEVSLVMNPTPEIDPTLSRVLHRLLDRLSLRDVEIRALRYDPGGFRSLHHDSGIWRGRTYKEDGESRRLFTGLLYLNDVPSGGETVFPALDLRVAPRAGKLLLFPNYRTDVQDRWALDPDAAHEALACPTTKYVLNLWFSQDT